MTKEEILKTASDRHYGALLFMSELMDRISKENFLAGAEIKLLIDIASRASQESATAIRVWENEQLKRNAQSENPVPKQFATTDVANKRHPLL